jgi:hypothetical protein
MLKLFYVQKLLFHSRWLFRNFKFLSNLFYLIPFAIAIHWHFWITAFLCLAIILFGTIYHFYKERWFFWPDSISAWALIFTNVELCYWGHFTIPYFWLVCFFVALACFQHFYLQEKNNYDLNHGLWHIYGALITLFCILTYAL